MNEDSPNVRPIRADVTPTTDIEREFLDLALSIMRYCSGDLCAIAVVALGSKGAAHSGVYSIPDLPTRWIAATGAAALTELAADCSCDEGLD